jgi:hypothetical protein
VIEIVEVYERLHAGGGFNSAAMRVWRELIDKAQRLNKETV